MRGAAVLAIVLALVAWDAWRGDLPEVVLPPAAGDGASPAVGGARPDEAGARPGRDPFRFDAAPAGPAPPPPPPREDAATGAPVPEPEQPVRLVGFIRQGEELRAALSVLDRVALVAEGESVDGYTLVGIEEDVGVRIRSPDGGEHELRLPAR